MFWSAVRPVYLFLVLAIGVEVTQMTEIRNAFTIIRDNFHHVARLGIRQYAATLRMRGVEGRLYVSGLNQWEWSPLSGLASCILTDKELESLVSPIEVCRTLLRSGEDTMIQLLHQMDCVEARVCTNSTAWMEPGTSQTEVIINELFRPQVRSVSPISTRVM
jgi:hypothetical protein